LKKKKRIFIGVTEISGFGIKFKQAFNKIGVKADFYEYNKHPFGFKSDRIITFSANRFLKKIQKVFLLTKIIFKYDYFLFISTNSLLPKYRDIKLLRKFGKKTMIMFSGCDVRIPDSVMKFKWNPCRECTQEYKDYVGCVIESKKMIIREAEEAFNLIGSPMEAAGYLNKPFYNWFGQFNPEDFPKEKYSNYQLHKPIKIFHAPSHPVYKGTKYINDVIEKLKIKYTLEYKALSNVSYETYLNELSDSDLIIDQMLLGTYGSVGIEAMFMYKPVVCYLREDFWEIVKNDCPIYNANPDNLYEVLDNILSNPSQLKETGKKSRQFAEKYHSDIMVAQNVYNYFENRIITNNS